MGVLALSTAATLALVAGIVVSVAFVGALVALAIRRRGLARRTSPGDEARPVRRHPGAPAVRGVMAWGTLFASSSRVPWLSFYAAGWARSQRRRRPELLASPWSVANGGSSHLGGPHGVRVRPVPTRRGGLSGAVIPFTGRGGPRSSPIARRRCARLTIEGRDRSGDDRAGPPGDARARGASATPDP